MVFLDPATGEAVHSLRDEHALDEGFESRYLERTLGEILKEKRERLKTAAEQLLRTMRETFRARQTRWELLTVTLHGLSPTAKLVKGFGYITTDRGPLTSVDEAAPGEGLKIRIHDGEVGARVEEVRKKKIGEE